MLNASASEAFAARGQNATKKSPQAQEVRAFLASDKNHAPPKPDASGTVKKESSDMLYLESRERSQWLHKSYLRK
jgi:hypothetical protein